MNTTVDPATALAAKAGVCTVLSGLFWTPPTGEYVRLLRDADAADALNEYCSLIGVRAESEIETLRDCVSTDDCEAMAERLNIESVELFGFGASDREAVPLYGSLWLGDRALVMDTVTQEVAAFYREQGFTSAHDSSDVIPDHISRELEFVAALFRIAAAAELDGDIDDSRHHQARAQEFLERFASRWWREFGELTERTAKEPFYVAAGGLLGKVAPALYA